MAYCKCCREKVKKIDSYICAFRNLGCKGLHLSQDYFCKNCCTEMFGDDELHYIFNHIRTNNHTFCSQCFYELTTDAKNMYPKPLYASFDFWENDIKKGHIDFCKPCFEAYLGKEFIENYLPECEVCIQGANANNDIFGPSILENAYMQYAKCGYTTLPSQDYIEYCQSQILKGLVIPPEYFDNIVNEKAKIK